MLKKSNNIYLTNDGSYTLYNSLVKEHYHSTHGAVQESKHVFIANGIAPLFKRKPMPKMINILEVGFGTGLNALLSIDISELHEVKLNYTSLEPYPLCQNEIKQLNYFNFFVILFIFVIFNPFCNKYSEVSANFVLFLNIISLSHLPILTTP